MKNVTLGEKPDAENSHVQIDERDVAPEKPRHRAFLDGRLWLRIVPCIPLALVLWLAFVANWAAMYTWLGIGYMILYVCACIVNMFGSGRVGLFGFALSYHCSKFSGILFLAWLRWGLGTGWMSGYFGLLLLVGFLVAYVIGLILAPLGPAFVLEGRVGNESKGCRD